MSLTVKPHERSNVGGKGVTFKVGTKESFNAILEQNSNDIVQPEIYYNVETGELYFIIPEDKIYKKVYFTVEQEKDNI